MAENASSPESQQKPKSRKFLFIIIAAVVLLMAGAGFFALRHFKGAKPVADAHAAVPSEETGGRHGMKSTLSLEPFLVNLADTENPRFLKVTFRLGLSEAKLGEELAADPVALAAARDTIISLLSTKTADQILTSEGKDHLRDEVRTKVNAVLPKGKVGEVYIVDFVVQM